MKKGDVIIIADDDDDDEVRTSGSQNCATATRCTEEFLLRTQHIALPSQITIEVWRGQDIDSQATHIDDPG